MPALPNPPGQGFFVLSKTGLSDYSALKKGGVVKRVLLPLPDKKGRGRLLTFVKVENRLHGGGMSGNIGIENSLQNLSKPNIEKKRTGQMLGNVGIENY